MTRKSALGAVLIAAGLGLYAFVNRASLEPLFEPAVPYERYVARLHRSGLDQTALGRDWLAAGDAALGRASAVVLPLRDTGGFDGASARAVGYRLTLERGRTLSVEVTFQAPEAGDIFADVFDVSTPGQPRRVAHMAPGASGLTYQVDRDGPFVLRLQPELLRGGTYTVVQRTLASLSFPVQGSSTKAVRSVFGSARDGGARTHHGVDIFAPRGTPVVAAADGLAMTSNNNLGGKVVWQRASGTGHTLYYAHLDDWAIETAALVKEGDVLGYVGNTGNARTTRPHLHFGIYAAGPVDPLPFIRPDDRWPPEREDTRVTPSRRRQS